LLTTVVLGAGLVWGLGGALAVVIVVVLVLARRQRGLAEEE